MIWHDMIFICKSLFISPHLRLCLPYIQQPPLCSSLGKGTIHKSRHCWIYWILWALFLLINLPSMFFKFSTLSCLTFKAQLEKPFLVHIKGGLVERFFVYNDEANFVSNIRRSFLSQIQLDLSRYSQFWIPDTRNPESSKNWMFWRTVVKWSD